jgi:hypothetical protein
MRGWKIAARAKAKAEKARLLAEKVRIEASYGDFFQKLKAKNTANLNTRTYKDTSANPKPLPGSFEGGKK